jgi:hypothetical protein
LMGVNFNATVAWDERTLELHLWIKPEAENGWASLTKFI